MTLILSLTTPSAVCHASDRRVTLLRSDSSSSIHSTVENKSLIFICRDAVGILGYTGLAYIDCQPTDQWIASQLLRLPNEAPWLSGHMVSTVGIGALTLNTLVWRLHQALARLNLPREAPYLEIMGAGYRRRRSRTETFLVGIDRNPSGVRLSSRMRSPRSRTDQVQLAQIGDGADGQEPWHHVNEGIRAANAGPWGFPSALVHAIRERSKQTHTVGRDVMTVIIRNSPPREITWHFHPSEPHDAVLTLGERNFPVEAVYSPWILGPSIIWCPTVATLGFQAKVG